MAMQSRTIDLDFDRHHVWHPYTSVTAPLPVYPVSRAYDVFLELEENFKTLAPISNPTNAENNPITTAHKKLPVSIQDSKSPTVRNV